MAERQSRRTDRSPQILGSTALADNFAIPFVAGVSTSSVCIDGVRRSELAHRTKQHFRIPPIRPNRTAVRVSRGQTLDVLFLQQLIPLATLVNLQTARAIQPIADCVCNGPSIPGSAEFTSRSIMARRSGISIE